MYTPVRELPQNEHRELSQNESICVIWLVTSKRRLLQPDFPNTYYSLSPSHYCLYNHNIRELP